MPETYDLRYLEELLSDEDPREIARLLDDILSMMVHYSAYEGELVNLADRYHMIRLLRDTFCKTAQLPLYGNR